jgi:hypothetical protein
MRFRPLALFRILYLFPLTCSYLLFAPYINLIHIQQPYLDLFWKSISTRTDDETEFLQSIVHINLVAILYKNY